MIDYGGTRCRDGVVYRRGVRNRRPPWERLAAFESSAALDSRVLKALQKRVALGG